MAENITDKLNKIPDHFLFISPDLVGGMYFLATLSSSDENVCDTLLGMRSSVSCESLDETVINGAVKQSIRLVMHEKHIRNLSLPCEWLDETVISWAVKQSIRSVIQETLFFKKNCFVQGLT